MRFQHEGKSCSDLGRVLVLDDPPARRKCIYAPCINAPAHLIIQRAHFARDAGAGGVLMIPGLTGLDTMRELAADASFGLPIICHPALLGAMLGGGSKGRVGGFAHEAGGLLITSTPTTLHLLLLLLLLRTSVRGLSRTSSRLTLNLILLLCACV
jgi:hypothetical protein